MGYTKKAIKVGLTCTTEGCNCEGDFVDFGLKGGPYLEIPVCSSVVVKISDDDTYVDVMGTATALGLTKEEFLKCYGSIYPEKGYQEP